MKKQNATKNNVRWMENRKLDERKLEYKNITIDVRKNRTLRKIECQMDEKQNVRWT